MRTKLTVNNGYPLMPGRLILPMVGLTLGFGSLAPAKPQLPADLQLSTEAPAVPGGVVSVRIDVSVRVPVDKGTLTISIPSVAEKPAEEKVLWKGTLDSLATVSRTVPLGALPIGKYAVKASFQFALQGRGSQLFGLSKRLFLDVRIDRILFSNVSFRQIKRVELRQKLVARNLANLLKSELKSRVPSLFKRMEELNREDAEELKPALPKGKGEMPAVDGKGEPIRQPTPPVAGAKPTTEVPIPAAEQMKEQQSKE